MADLFTLFHLSPTTCDPKDCQAPLAQLNEVHSQHFPRGISYPQDFLGFCAATTNKGFLQVRGKDGPGDFGINLQILNPFTKTHASYFRQVISVLAADGITDKVPLFEDDQFGFILCENAPLVSNDADVRSIFFWDARGGWQMDHPVSARVTAYLYRVFTGSEECPLWSGIRFSDCQSFLLR